MKGEIVKADVVAEGLARIDQDQGALMGISEDRFSHTHGLLQVLLRRKCVIALVAIAVLAAGAIYAFKCTRIYRAGSRVHVEMRSPNIMQIKGIISEENEGAAYLNTQCELIKSRRILSAAIEKTGIEQLPTLGGARDPVPVLNGLVNAAVERKTEVINVSCESPYPEEVAKVTNALVEAYLDYHAERRKSTAAEVLKTLEKQQEDLDKQLREKEAKLLAFEQKHGTLSFGMDKENIVLTRLSALNQAMTTAQIQRINAEVAYNVIKALADKSHQMRGVAESLGGDTGMVVNVTGRDDALRTHLLNARNALASLQERGLGPHHPKVVAKQKEIQSILDELNLAEKQLAETRQTVAQQNLLAACDKETSLVKLVTAQKQLAQEQDKKAVEYNWLSMDVGRTRKLHDVVVSRIKELNVTEDYGVLNINVIDVAQVPESPIWPQKGRIVAASMILGLLAGGLVALVVDRLDTTMKSAEEVEDVIGRPTLGMIPSMPTDGDHTRFLNAAKTYLKPTSVEAEAFRTVRTAIYFSSAVGDTKTVLITSPAPGEGKTIVACNLAIAMAQSGQRTVLVDGDFRRPCVHKSLELERDWGISTVLVGKASLQDVIKRSFMEGLDVVTCGEIPPNPAEMLGSQRFAELLKELANRYDRVIVDSPPVLAVADARILSRICNTVVAVIRAKQSSRVDATRMRDSLAKVGSRLMGVVVNDIPRRRNGYYYGSKYYRYYDYYHTPDDHEGNGDGGLGKYCPRSHKQRTRLGAWFAGPARRRCSYTYRPANSFQEQTTTEERV